MNIGTVMKKAQDFSKTTRGQAIIVNGLKAIGGFALTIGGTRLSCNMVNNSKGTAGKIVGMAGIVTSIVIGSSITGNGAGNMVPAIMCKSDEEYEEYLRYEANPDEYVDAKMEDLRGMVRNSFDSMRKDATRVTPDDFAQEVDPSDLEDIQRMTHEMTD